jgi:hypothetical protein
MYYCIAKIDDGIFDDPPHARSPEKAIEDLPERFATLAEAEEALDNFPPPEKGFRYAVQKRGLGWDETYEQWEQRRRKAYFFERPDTLTPVDVDNIVRGDFAPDVSKLVRELKPYVGDPIALRALGAFIAARYGQDGLRKVWDHARDIYGDKEATLDGMYDDACAIKKRTTKAEFVRQHIDALVKLLQNEPDAVVDPILDSLLERINWSRLEHFRSTQT